MPMCSPAPMATTSLFAHSTNSRFKHSEGFTSSTVFSIENYEKAGPGFGASRSTFGNAGPSFGSSQSTFGNSVPVFASSQSTFGNAGPSFRSSQSTFGNSVPVFGSSQSTFGNAAPAFGSSQSTFGNSGTGFSFGASQSSLVSSQNIVETPVEQLISIQSFDGSYLLDEKLSNILGKTLIDLKEAASTSNLNESVLATALAISIFSTQFGAEKDIWELVALKARKWLTKAVSAEKIDEVTETASNYLLVWFGAKNSVQSI